MSNKKLKILIPTSELYPIAKVVGLGDAVYGLGKALQCRGMQKRFTWEQPAEKYEDLYIKGHREKWRPS